MSPPRPCPPVAVRPSRLSVTEIETWLRDPYAIYAKHILRLPALKPLDQETDAADYGMLVHSGLHLFLRVHGVVWPADAAGEMRRAMRRALAESFARPALTAWWEPRLDRIADWVVETEQARRGGVVLSAIETEIAGTVDIQRPGRRFRLVARADRIERWEDGRLAIRLAPLAPPDDDARPWLCPLAVRAAFRWEPALVQTMRPNQLAEQVLAGTSRIAASASRRFRPSPDDHADERAALEDRLREARRSRLRRIDRPRRDDDNGGERGAGVGDQAGRIRHGFDRRERRRPRQCARHAGDRP